MEYFLDLQLISWGIKITLSESGFKRWEMLRIALLLFNFGGVSRLRIIGRKVE